MEEPREEVGRPTLGGVDNSSQQLSLEGPRHNAEGALLHRRSNLV